MVNTQYQYQYLQEAKDNTQYQYQYCQDAEVNTQYQYQYRSQGQYLNTNTRYCWPLLHFIRNPPLSSMLQCDLSFPSFYLFY